MKSLSSIGLGLSIIFCCLLLALVVEVYYLLWWKKRLITRRDIENDYSNPAREFLYMFCWKRSSSSSSSSMTHSAFNPQEIGMAEEQQSHHQLHHLYPNKDNLLLKPFDQDHHGMENELMRLHSLSGPPRFLFTIIEETKEDLESEEAKSRCDDNNKSRGRSFSDLLLTVETPYLTPLASPPFFTPPLTPMDASSCYSQHGFNPLFESAADAEFNRVRSSPPPKFKFLQEAEEKLHRKKLMERVDNYNDGFGEDINGDMTPPSEYLKDEEDGSFITINVDRNRETGLNKFNHDHQQQFHSQVLLPSNNIS
ncbi:hypothetical protein PTKIN_Ptkin13bG0181900 [Pterospermum kingtungense]